MRCTDPAIDYLKSYGYNVVRLPKPDIKPLQILADQGSYLSRLGDLSTVLESKTVAIPSVSSDNQAPTISGQRTSNLSLGTGLSILGNVIGAMGGSSLGLDAKYQNADTVAFEFTDVLEDNIQIAQLDQFLGAADINPSSRHVSELLESDDIYIITDTVKSKKVRVGAQASGGSSVTLKVPEIQGIVGGNVTVSESATVTGTLTYAGTVPLVFGFQAVRVFYEGGRYRSFEALPPGGVVLAALRNVPNDRASRFMCAGPFVRFRS